MHRFLTTWVSGTPNPQAVQGSTVALTSLMQKHPDLQISLLPWRALLQLPQSAIQIFTFLETADVLSSTWTMEDF